MRQGLQELGGKPTNRVELDLLSGQAARHKFVFAANALIEKKRVYAGLARGGQTRRRTCQVRRGPVRNAIPIGDGGIATDARVRSSTARRCLARSMSAQMRAAC